MPHDRLQEFVIIDYTKQMVILAVVKEREKGEEEKERIVGIGQYYIDEVTHTADVAFAVRDDYQGKGICTKLFSYLTCPAKKPEGSSWFYCGCADGEQAHAPRI